MHSVNLGCRVVLSSINSLAARKHMFNCNNAGNNNKRCNTKSRSKIPLRITCNETTPD